MREEKNNRRSFDFLRCAPVAQDDSVLATHRFVPDQSWSGKNGKGGQMKQDGKAKMLLGGVAGWLQGRLLHHGRAQSRLELVERITLAPRHSLALVEAEGRRFLVATSPEGAPSFYPLDGRARSGSVHGGGLGARVSW